MVKSSLYQIEKTFATLWMNAKTRNEFIEKEALECEFAVSHSQESFQQIKKGVLLYCQLINYGHQEVMHSIYPGCAYLIGEKWHGTVCDYLEHYPPNHYSLNKLGKDFITYLESYSGELGKRYPFIVELADYEWLEMELIEQDAEVPFTTNLPMLTADDFEQFAPIVNPVMALRSYKFPIPGVVDYLTNQSDWPERTDPKPTFVVVCRHPQTRELKFLEISKSVYHLLLVASNTPHSYKELLTLLIKDCPSPEPVKLVSEFIELVERLHSLSVFIGSVSIK